MADGVSFKIEGAKQFEALLKQLGAEIAGKVGDQAVRAGAKVIAKEAQRLAPVRTGELRDSIAVVVERKRKGENERLAAVGIKGPAARRAHLSEFGSSRQAARPFLRPALDSQAGEVLDAMGKSLGRGVEREAKRLAKPLRK